ncbi:ATP-binding cassette domain-containing protein [Burkholderiaceae bacterium DAT-1]|nr:ATP-binding cassette domain-containing protein [Burkholderiaceae bacterium DAT-1]
MSHSHLSRLRILRPVAVRLGLGGLFMLITVAVQMIYPRALSHFIDHLNTLMTPASVQPYLIQGAALLLFQAVMMALRFYLFDSAGHMIVTQVREQLFRAMLSQHIAFFDKHHAAELGNRLAVDVEVLQETLTMELAISLRSLCVFIGGSIMLVSISPTLSLALLAYIPVSVWLGQHIGKQYRARSKLTQDQLAYSARVAQEHLTHIRQVQAFNQQALAQSRYEAACRTTLTQYLSNSRLFSVFRSLYALLTFAVLLFTLWLGARLIGEGALTVGSLTAFIVYGAMVTESSDAIGQFWNSWMRMMGATEHVFELMNESAPAPVQSALPPLMGQVTFEHVWFAYPERPQHIALHDVSFDIRAGEKIALVGASGAGKSTIASLLLGHYQADQGYIRVDGMPLSPDAIPALRAQIAIVEQEPSLFSGTIHDNIAFGATGTTVSREAVIAVAREANADDFIRQFPHGYDTEVGERGVQLSGGQKQRIAIARAMLRNPRILILDEATSALDAASEHQVQLALTRLMQGRTAIIIAHRYSTIMHADRILVMEHGSLLESGHHAELMQNPDGRYARLIHLQLAGLDHAAQHTSPHQIDDRAIHTFQH